MVLDSFLVALFGLRLSSGVLCVCHILLSLRFSAIFFKYVLGVFVIADGRFCRCGDADSVYYARVRYSVAASISSLVFSGVEAEVVWVKSSLKSCQLVCWL